MAERQSALLHSILFEQRFLLFFPFSFLFFCSSLRLVCFWLVRIIDAPRGFSFSLLEQGVDLSCVDAFKNDDMYASLLSRFEIASIYFHAEINEE